MDLDFRQIHLGQHSIDSHALKADAVSSRIARNTEEWTIVAARNRFCRFWVLVRSETDGRFCVARRGGGQLVLAAHPGYLSGKMHYSVQ